MNRRIAWSFLLGKFILISLAFGDEGGAALKTIPDNAFVLKIVARVKEKEKSPVFHMEVTRLTISGRAVTVQLKGEDILVLANFTPYWLPDNSILLVAHGQVWQSEDEKGGKKALKYKSTLKSLHVTPGETILFYPTGVSEKTESSDIQIIELEIQINPFTKKYIENKEPSKEPENRTNQQN